MPLLGSLLRKQGNVGDLRREAMSNATSTQQNNKAEGKPILVKFVEHRPIIFWWPVWVSGYVIAAVNYWYYTDAYIIAEMQKTGANGHTMVNLIYITLIILTLYFTNVRTDIQTTLLVLTGALVVILAAYIIITKYDIGSVWILENIPKFKVYMNANFYFWFSTGLAIMWGVVVFVIDQRRYWFMQKGVITRVQHAPKETEDYILDSAAVSHKMSDFPCHYLLGLCQIGDVTLQVGPTGGTYTIKNVAWVGVKQKKANQLIKPT
jgi:hypothetical protein